MNKTKKILIGSFVVSLIIIVAGVSWFFPFSQSSINKSFSYKADPVVVEQYKADLKSFKNKYEENTSNHNSEEPTMDRIKYIIQMYEEDSFLGEEPAKITKQRLDTLLFEVKETREMLIELSFEESYEKDADDFLKLLLINTLSLEDEIQNLIHSNANSRFTLNRQFSNLYMGFNGNLKLLESFYDEYTKTT